MVTWWEQAISFGATGRVEAASAEYDRTFQRARSLEERLEEKRKKVADTFCTLVAVKKACLPVLGRIRLLSKNIATRDRQFVIESVGATPEFSAARIQRTINGGAIAQAAAKGVVAGTSTALGAWALVGSYGAASTGTALASLSGAAAQSATLAWFGGGSLAAGGAGAAGGAVVIGGVVAIPALAVMAVLAHSRANKQIAKIEIEASKVEKAIDDMMKLELVVDLAERRACELIDALRKGRSAFEHVLRDAFHRLYPRGLVSRIYRWIRKTFGLGYFQPDEIPLVQKALNVAAEFAGIIDQPVFDGSGSVRKESP